MIVRDPGLGKYTEAPNPRHVYTTLKAAQRAAKGLALKDGRKFYILRSYGVMEPSLPPVSWSLVDQRNTEVDTESDEDNY